MAEAITEPPAFAVDASYDLRLAHNLPANATLIWEDTPNIYAWGNLSEHRLHTAVHPLGRVAIIGDCFADTESLQKALGQALEKQEPALLTSLPGAYTTILVEQDRTTVLKDVAGTSPVYFNTGTEGTVVSSKPSVIAGPKGLRPNLTHVSANLLMRGVYDSSSNGNESCFEGVSSLGGGQALQVSYDTSKPYTYEPLIPEPSISLEEAAHNLRFALQEAIKARLDNTQATGATLGATLSGGKDSSSIVSLLLEQIGENTSLPVFFMKSPQIMGGDSKYVDSYISQDDRLNLTTFDPHDIPEVIDPTRVPQAEDLLLAVHPHRWEFMNALNAFVRESGTEVYLTGDGGDQVGNIGLSYLSDLARPRHISRFIKEGLAWARINNTSAIQVWREMIRASHEGPAGALRRAANNLDTVTTSSPLSSWQPDGLGMKLITEEARIDLAAFLRNKAANMHLPTGFTNGDFMAREELRGSANDGAMITYHATIGTPGFSIQSPFYDHNVVRAAFAVAAHKKGSPFDYKLIIQEALQGLMPTQVLERKTSGAYDPYNRELHLHSLRSLAGRLESSHLVALGIIDKQKVQAVLNNLDTASQATIWTLSQLLSTELWLDSLDRAGHPIKDGYRPISTKKVETYTSRPLIPETPVSTIMRYSTPVSVQAISSSGGSLVIFDSKANNYIPLDRTQSHTLRTLAATGSYAQTIARLKEIYPRVDPALIETSSALTIQNFIRLGIVQTEIDAPARQLPTTAKAPRFMSHEFTMAIPKREEKGSLNDRVAAAAMLAGSLILERVAPSKQMPLLEFVQKKWAKRAATQAEAEKMLITAQRLGYIGRMACKESSYTAALALAVFKRRRVAIHRGVSFTPLQYHMWLEAEDKPVRTNSEGSVYGNYQTFSKEDGRQVAYLAT